MRVLALTRSGGYAASVRVAAHNVFKIPALIDFDRAVGLFANYLTAYQLLVVMGGSHWKKRYKLGHLWEESGKIQVWMGHQKVLT